MYIGGMMKHLLFTLMVTAALAACRVEDTKPQVENNSRLRAVMEAERKRAEALAKSQPSPMETPPENASPPPRPTPDSPSAAAPAAAPPPRYLPPSAQGAYVEMTETPAGVPPPPASPKPSGDTGRAGQAQGPAGGNVPQGIAPNRMNGTAAAPQPGTAGTLRPQGRPPPARGLRGSVGMPQGDAAATAAELKQNRAEFERLMQQQSGSGGGEQAPASGYGGRRGGAGNSSGLGASPDLSGEVGANPHPSTESAVRAPTTGDQSIVARQLREAAEREQDPELKRKLLLEYQKYTRP